MLFLVMFTAAATLSRAQVTPTPPDATEAPATATPSAPAPTVPGPRVTPQTPPPGPGDNVGIIDFQNAPLQALLDLYSRFTNRSVILAPGVNAIVTFRSQVELTRDEALQAMDSVLAVNGLSLLPMGEKFLKVVQIASAKQEGVQIGVNDATKFPASDTFMAQVVKIGYADLAETKAAIQPLLHPYGHVEVMSQSSSLLIIDTANNVNQILELLKHVDQPYELRMERKVYQLRHAKAADAVKRIQDIVTGAQLLKPKAGAGAPTPGTPAPAPTAGPGSVVETKLILTPDERTNKIFVFSRSKDFTLLDSIITELDVKVEPEVTTRLIALDYADANEVVAAISSLIGGGGVGGSTSGTGNSRSGSSSRQKKSSSMSGSSTSPTTVSAPRSVTGESGAADSAFLTFAEGLRMSPDPRTNSILLLGSNEDLDRLVKLIKSLDSSVPQVLIEVIIGEVRLSNATDLGVDIINRVINTGPANLFGGTAVIPPSATGGSALLPQNLGAAAIGSTPSGAALSAALTYFATFRGLKLDVLVHALAATSRFKVLSTPVIQTLHNQEGSIIVGSSVPVATSTLSDVVSNGSSSTNQITSGLRANVEYKDVALELNVTPRINPDGYVTLEINQKVNDLGEDKNVGGIVVPTIIKREARSTVTVKDQNTIVLGGLITSSKTTSDSKVPFLGDIPLLGWLFRYRKDAVERQELIMFIRPVVLRTDMDTLAETKRRTQMLESVKDLGVDKRFPVAVTNTPPTVTAPPKPEPHDPPADLQPRRGTTPSKLKIGK